MRDEMKSKTHSSFCPHPSSFIPHPFLKLGCGDLFYHIRLDLIANLDVVEVFQANAAFKTFAHFRYVVLEAAQRSDVAFPTHNTVPNQTRPRVATDVAVDDHRSG